MTPALILALALIGQADDPSSDLDFAEAVESWVKDAHDVKGYEQVLTRPEADLLRRLACPHAACRAAVLREIEARGDAAFRLLYYGRRATDGHVKATCTALYAARFICPACHGSGRCDHAGTMPGDYCPWCWTWTDSNWSWSCPECHGSGRPTRFR